MKLLRKFVLLTVLLGIVAMPLAPVTYAQAQDCPTAKDNYVIGFANLTEDIVFTQLVREGILAAAVKASSPLLKKPAMSKSFWRTTSLMAQPHSPMLTTSSRRVLMVSSNSRQTRPLAT